MTTVPNQNTVIVHKEMPEYNFLQIKNDNWQQMLRKTKDPYAFILYLYFAANANGYKFALSPKAIEEATGLPRSTYYKKLQVLKKAGYIVKGIGNQLHFYDVPQKTKSEEEIENYTCGGLSGRQENLAGEFENLGQRKVSFPQEQNSSPQNIEIDNRYIDKDIDKIKQALDILNSEESTPPKPNIFVF